MPKKRSDNLFPNTLFPGAGLREIADMELTDMLWLAYAQVVHDSVVPTFDRKRFSEELAGFDFDRSRDLRDTVKWTIDQMQHGLVHVTHPRYFGLFNPTPSFPSQVADRITSVFNPQLATFTTSPAAVSIEAHTIRAVAKRMGYPDTAFGHFTTGGAEANYTALLLALLRARPSYAADGVFAFGEQPRIYISADSHLAWLKIAHQAGIGRGAVRLVPTDGTGCMDVRRLTSMIETDRRTGYEPVMIVATAGTTNAGMIDPIGRTADTAKRFGLWLHVDAAWGGAVIASEVYAHLLADIEKADSATIDAHKWFATTMGCGMFLTRHPSLLSESFHVDTSYMPSQNSDDPYLSSVQWSRRFLGLRLFLALATVGWDGYGRHVERTLMLAEKFRRQIASAGWSVVNNSRLGVLCVKSKAPPRDVVSRVLATGLAWVSVTRFEGEDVIRVCVTSGETSEDDVSQLTTALLEGERKQDE